jgi:hypothetical protein
VENALYQSFSAASFPASEKGAKIHSDVQNNSFPPSVCVISQTKNIGKINAIRCFFALIQKAIQVFILAVI